MGRATSACSVWSRAVKIHRIRSVMFEQSCSIKTPYNLSQIRQDYPLNLSISVSGEKKLTRIPSVTASEAGRAQIWNHISSCCEL